MVETVYYGISGKETIIRQSEVEACEARRKSVENTIAIMLNGANGEKLVNKGG